jgi:hypothetical protein
LGSGNSPAKVLREGQSVLGVSMWSREWREIRKAAWVSKLVCMKGSSFPLFCTVPALQSPAEPLSTAMR